MNINGTFQILVYFGILLLLTKPLGLYMARVFQGEKTFLHPILRPIESGIYRIARVDEKQDMHWTIYTLAMLLFSAVGIVFTYLLLRLQGILPLNPQGFGVKEMTPDLAFNTAVSFASNTNWQSYVPETTVSYFSNMVSLAIHNWMSAATGIAIAIALVRGFARRSANGIGNFWVDIVRATVYVLLPIALVGGILFVASGVPQNFSPYQEVTTLEGAKQLIAQGPVASQEIIKQLGTNGGGIFNANSAHPYENPTPFSNLMTLVLIFMIPAGLTYTFGKMVGNTRQGWALFAAMSFMFLVGAFVCNYAEQGGNPHFAKAGIATEASALQPGGNMEGKETRFGIASSTLFATITTDASCGAVNSMHDSYTPLGGLVPLFNILTGEVIFGGVGSGLYGMLMLAILAVFIAGLMVGRTPEYIGKKIERFEVQMSMLAVLILAASVLGFAALSLNMHFAADSAWNRVGNTTTYLGSTTGNLNNSGSHGFSEILYAFASGTGNNGSAFAGITANTPYYNLTIGLAMLIGRFLMIIPLLAIAGSLAKKKIIPVSSGTFPTDSATFVALLVGVVLIVSALTYFPALALGPIVEHFQMNSFKIQ
jgi:K+-transporting ATPase ATPase A chain